MRVPGVLLLAITALACSSPPPSTPSPPGAAITGTVLEHVDGPPYSFLRLETDKGQVWVAVPMADVRNKSRVSVKNGAVLKHFTSSQAGRTFDEVVFGVLEQR